MCNRKPSRRVRRHQTCRTGLSPLFCSEQTTCYENRSGYLGGEEGALAVCSLRALCLDVGFSLAPRKPRHVWRGGKNNFPPTSPSSSGSTNNQINMRPINGRNGQIYCVCTHGSSMTTRELRTDQAVKAYKPYGAKEQGVLWFGT